LNNLELNRIPFLQALVALGSDCAIVHENISAVVPSNKAITLGVIEPLNRTFQTSFFHVLPLGTYSSIPEAVPTY